MSKARHIQEDSDVRLNGQPLPDAFSPAAAATATPTVTDYTDPTVVAAQQAANEDVSAYQRRNAGLAGLAAATKPGLFATLKNAYLEFERKAATDMARRVRY